MTFDELTPALREEIQLVYLRQYLGRIARETWHRNHLRSYDQGTTRLRVNALPKPPRLSRLPPQP